MAYKNIHLNNSTCSSHVDQIQSFNPLIWKSVEENSINFALGLQYFQWSRQKFHPLHPSVLNCVGNKWTSKSKIHQSKVDKMKGFAFLLMRHPYYYANQQKFEFYNLHFHFVINIRQAEITIREPNWKKKHIFDKILQQKLTFFPKWRRGLKKRRKENCRNVSRKNCQQNRKRLRNNEDENEDIKWLCERKCSNREDFSLR